MKLPFPYHRQLALGAVAGALLFLMACGTAATPTPGATTAPTPGALGTAFPTQPPQRATNTPTNTPANTAAPGAPTATPTQMAAPNNPPQTAKAKAIAVIATEPETLLALPSLDAHTSQLVDNISPAIGHLDRFTLEVSPTSQIVSWEQTAPDTWAFELRQGVTFHDGAPWNAQSWKTYAEFAGGPDYAASSYNHTGRYHIEPVDDYHVNAVCDAPCPLFARALNLSRSYSDQALTSKPYTELREGVGHGPYMVSEWARGQKIVTKKFDGFVPVAENPEYAAPILDEIEWQWREESTVRTAMIETGEADWAFLIGLDDAGRLGPRRFVTGGTSEMAIFRPDVTYDYWLSKKEMRQAIVHAIDCQGIVDSLYGGQTSCRGNFGQPGVLGITDENIKPYEYDPEMSRQLLRQIGYICGEAGADPQCGAPIKFTSRGSRIDNNTEMVEAMITFMKDVGINAQAEFVEVSISGQIRSCGVGSPGAQVVGWKGATENKRPECPGAQIVDHIGLGYELSDFGKYVIRHLSCASSNSWVCFPDREEEWLRATTLDGEERRVALEKIADEAHEEVYMFPMFDLYAIYGVNPKLRGFENPRFDKHLFANLWHFAP